MLGRHHTEWIERKQAAARARTDERKARNLAGLLSRSTPLVCRGTTQGGTTGPIPKTEPKRNRALLDMAQGRPCLLRVPRVCNHDPRTSVACHSNLSIHGKAGARKADDQYSVHGCSACHEWLDRGPATHEAKGLAFASAFIDQVLLWRRIAVDMDEPERFRKAAQWALDQLAATPVGALE